MSTKEETPQKGGKGQSFKNRRTFGELCPVLVVVSGMFSRDSSVCTRVWGTVLCAESVNVCLVHWALHYCGCPQNHVSRDEWFYPLVMA